MRIGTVLTVVAALSMMTTVARAQEPSAGGKAPGKGDAIAVKGCLQGPTLQAATLMTTEETGRAAGPLTFQLKGDKKLLKQMRDEHDGGMVEVDGVLKSALPQDSAPHSMQIGRTKVAIGIGTPSAQSGAPDLSSSLPVLEVKSYQGLAVRCGK